MVRGLGLPGGVSGQCVGWLVFLGELNYGERSEMNNGGKSIGRGVIVYCKFERGCDII